MDELLDRVNEQDIIIDQRKKKLGYEILLVEHLLERAKIKDCCN